MLVQYILYVCTWIICHFSCIRKWENTMWCDRLTVVLCKVVLNHFIFLFCHIWPTLKKYFALLTKTTKHLHLMLFHNSLTKIVWSCSFDEISPGVAIKKRPFLDFYFEYNSVTKKFHHTATCQGFCQGKFYSVLFWFTGPFCGC